MDRYRLTHDDFSMEAIAGSGQCFRIVMTGEDVWTVNAKGKLLSVKKENDGSFTFSCGKDEFDSIWRHYFDLDADYSRYRDTVLPDDAYLNKAISFGKGIRILNQDPWEMLITFIISQRKSVPAIRTSVERLSAMYGEKLEGYDAYAFPTPQRLASADTDGLSSCGLGYRVEYVRNAAKKVDSGELDLCGSSLLESDKLMERLMELKGVGIKVASCIALFAYHRMDILPVDVWMKRVIDEVYGGTLPEEYAPYAGILQQYMFNYARLNKGVAL